MFGRKMLTELYQQIMPKHSHFCDRMLRIIARFKQRNADDQIVRHFAMGKYNQHS